MTATTSRTDDLFAWSDGLIVLFVERDDGHWVIARGWRQADRLTDVRRWRFVDAERLLGQLRRLIRERTDHDETSAIAVNALAEWIAVPARAS